MDVNFNWKEMKFEGITFEQAERWEQMYDRVDVVRIVTKDIPLWLEKNQKTRKAHKKNWVRFILNWLSRSQKDTI